MGSSVSLVAIGDNPRRTQPLALSMQRWHGQSLALPETYRGTSGAKRPAASAQAAVSRGS